MFKSEVAFRGKNVPHNNLDMQVPIWLKDVHFLSNDGTADDGTAPGHVLVTSTAYSHVQIYDTRAQQRPVQSKHIKELEHPINCIRPSKSNKQLYVGDSAGTLCRLDLRKNFEVSGRYVGPVGSIRDISLHPTLPMIASGGYDRILSVWDTKTRKKVVNAYLKQRLTNVIFSPSGENDDFQGAKGSATKGDDDSDGETEEMQGLGMDDTSMDGEEADGDEEDDMDDEVRTGVVGSACGCCCNCWRVGWVGDAKTCVLTHLRVALNLGQCVFCACAPHHYSSPLLAVSSPHACFT
jgi:ribosome biogenesis protein NSA1